MSIASSSRCKIGFSSQSFVLAIVRVVREWGNLGEQAFIYGAGWRTGLLNTSSYHPDTLEDDFEYPTTAYTPHCSR